MCLVECLLDLSLAHPGQSGMLGDGGADAVVLPELPSTGSCWELHRQHGHAGSWPASAGEGACLSQPPPHHPGAARGGEKPQEDADEVSLNSAACASACHSSRSWR